MVDTRQYGKRLTTVAPQRVAQTIVILVLLNINIHSSAAHSPDNGTQGQCVESRLDERIVS